jgi:hypothetical protein
MGLRKHLTGSKEEDISNFIDDITGEFMDDVYDTLKELYVGNHLDSTIYKLIYKVLDRVYNIINQDDDFDFYIYPDNVSVFHKVGTKLTISKADTTYGDYSIRYKKDNLSAIRQGIRSLIEDDEELEDDDVDFICVNNIVFPKGEPFLIIKNKG